MASRSLSRTKSSLSWTLVSLVLRGSENSWKKLSSGSKLLSVWTNSIYLLEQKFKWKSKPMQTKKSVTPWGILSLFCVSRYLLVNQFVTYFTGKEDVRAQAKLTTESLVAHSLPEVPQAEDRCQSHEAIRVVSCFGCHVSLFSSSDERHGDQGNLGGNRLVRRGLYS